MSEINKDTLYIDSVLIPYPDSNGFIGRYSALILTDGFDITARMNFKLPFAPYVGIYALVVSGGTGNLRRSVNTNFHTPGEAYNTHAGVIAAGQVAVTINIDEQINIAAALAGVTQRDVIGLEFTREASNILDTVNAVCYFLGVLITRS